MGEPKYVCEFERERLITLKQKEMLGIYRNFLLPHAPCTRRVVPIQLGLVHTTCCTIGQHGHMISTISDRARVLKGDHLPCPLYCFNHGLHVAPY